MATIDLNNPDPAVLDGRQIRGSAFESAQRELLERLGAPSVAIAQSPPRAVVIGAGYSRLPTLVAAAGYAVTAIDCSPRATAEAQRRHGSGDQSSRFLTGAPDDLDVPAASCELIWCIDTLEVVENPAKVVAEIARIAKPGARIVFDTVNRTPISRAIYLALFQAVPFTAIMPPRRYAAARLRTPEEVAALGQAAGLQVEENIGFEPTSPKALFSGLLRRRSGRVDDAGIAALDLFHLSAPGHTPAVTYYALATPTAQISS